VELCSASDFWGAHACGVLVAAFCRNELSLLLAEFALGQQYKSSRRQNAIASTPQACAPQKALALGAKHD